MLEFNDEAMSHMAKESMKLVEQKYDVRTVNENIIKIINY